MLKREILELNTQRSAEFCNPVMCDIRALYASQHPTNILVFKCMDGRINLPLITGIPVGVLHPYRNIGGIFELGVAYLGRLVLDAKDDAIREGRPTLVLCTYHFSKGSNHRGCAGHKYDTKAARRGAFRLKKEFEAVFGANNEVISSIVVGIETDEDALIFCNGNGKEFSIAEHVHASDDDIRRELFALYPTLSNRMVLDILPLALGNRDHVAAIRKNGRPVAELVHGENIICVGRGFDSLHLPNRALIIGPYGHEGGTWREAVEVAGHIVNDNFTRDPQLKKGGALLITSAPYKNISERGIALVKTYYFWKVARNVLTSFAQIHELETLICVTNMQTMKFEEVTKEELAMFTALDE